MALKREASASTGPKPAGIDDPGLFETAGDGRHRALHVAGKLEKFMTSTSKTFASVLVGASLLSACNTTNNGTDSDGFREGRGEGFMPEGLPGPDGDDTMR